MTWARGAPTADTQRFPMARHAVAARARTIFQTKSAHGWPPVYPPWRSAATLGIGRHFDLSHVYSWQLHIYKGFMSYIKIKLILLKMK